MAATIIGTIATDEWVVKKQTLSRDRSGLLSMAETWLVNTSDIATVFPAQGTAHPDYSFLFFQSFTVTDIGIELATASVIYEGAVLTAGTTAPFYTYEATTMVVPISQHPSIATWVASERTAGRDPAPFGLFVGWRFGAVSSAGQSLYGVDSYEAPSAVYRKEWVSSSDVSSSDMEELGKIDTPGGSPATPTNTNWLCIGLSSRQLGTGMYARSQTWKLSQANSGGGWNSDVY